MRFLTCCLNTMTPKRLKLVIIYGTQTGQSKSIAEDIKLKATEKNYDVEMMSMDESIDKMPWNDYRYIIFVTSSTGDGDPPENAGLFWRKIRSKDLSQTYLSNVEYALLGLGDTNYTTYLGFPKGVEKQLQKLGARQFYKSGWADDAVGLEIVVDPWIENLWPALVKQSIDPQTILVPILETFSNSVEASNAAVIDDKKEAMVKTQHSSKVEKTLDVVKKDEVEKCLDNLASLTLSVVPLSECDLKIPVLPQPYFKLTYAPGLGVQPESDLYKLPMPSSKSQVFPAAVKSINKLTSENALKTTLEVTMDLAKANFEFEPGDAVGVYCSNDSKEVEALVSRLNLQDIADVPYVLSVKEELAGIVVGGKPKYEIPAHLPCSSTLRFILTHCCEIRSVPRKALIRILAEFTSCASEKRRLLELCSVQGSEDYTQLIRQPNINILDLLKTFPSCQPPIERILEQLPRLLARPYSLASSPLIDPNSVKFLLNVVEFSSEQGRTYERLGVATGAIKQFFEKFKSPIIDDVKLSVYLRTNNGFRMPDDLETPMILIGPGTGIAPFLGFLAHREELVKRSPDLQFGPIWLLYGCRDKDHDYLYRTELERWHSTGILTRLLVCFSRNGNPSTPKYVQDFVHLHKTPLVKLISKGALIYVCGDAKNMAKDVMEAVISAIQTVRAVDESEAKKMVLQLQKEKRYLQDIWT